MFDWLKSFFFEDSKVEFLRTKFRLNKVLKPKNMGAIPVFKAARYKFTAPRTVDLRDYCPPTEDQGSTPQCAAYTAAHWASNVRWRLDNYLTHYNPDEIYKLAKQKDEYPNQDGTTLTAVLQSIRDDLGLFDQKCEIAVIGNDGDPTDDIKFAIHKFGAVLLGMEITDEWYLLTPSNDTVTGDKGKYTLGGHAVLACGYDKTGVIIQNSWGEDWGECGYAIISWEAFKKQFQYGAVLINCLDGMKI